MTRVKICGLTREQDVAVAVEAGADALGFVFASSPRRLDALRAARLTASVPDGTLRVGLFMNQAASAVRRVLAEVELDLLQFHGSEDNAYCTAFGMPFIKAIAMRGGDPLAQADAVPDAVGLLLDSHAPGGAGGSGKAFAWDDAPDFGGRKVWLAGGLNPDNVGAAIAHFQPWAVDVSSGVEASPGIKDPERVRAFIEQAKSIQ